MELIADAGHFAAFLQPEQFLRYLLTHVSQLADAPGGDRNNAVITAIDY